MNKKYGWTPDPILDGGEYRDIAYVTRETESLARQLAAVTS